MIDAMQYQLGVDPAQLLLGLDALRVRPFPVTSRYYNVPVKIVTDASGEDRACLARRFSPDPDRLALVRLHAVVEHERLDLVAAREIGDPEQFWRICDANRALRPDDLEQVGLALRITLPEGVPGAGDA
ncbi:hypothetical protein FHW12_004204 [Dokdonella fugitiva]|jgi:hypothetical protein|uniref:LysM domain-containing protein n=1 Tax=Dokdonella fugitiva TaxID=328517 RepID=A0A839EZ15_9GAMM|nr:LysM domain-containing protein [Dokdonella fugitiva]MBA8889957.1 hypothetical protein [Dokdonella fugitiva]